jgi:peptide/nickel transport system substrate-binding protein
MKRFRSALAAAMLVSLGVVVAAQPAAAAPKHARAAHMGGTLRLTYQGAFGSWDPQRDYTLEGWQMKQPTQDALTAFKKVAGTAAYTVVPDLASAIPTPTDGGKTWVFHIRKGIKFSNGKVLKPTDILYTYQRIFKDHGPTASSMYGVIVGATACLKTPATCTLKGGVAANNAASTVTFHLTTPDSAWLQKTSIPLSSIVPAGTPNKDTGDKPIPSTGPYMLKSYDPNHMLTLVRNPYFKVWNKDAQPQGYPDVITERYDLTGEAEVTQVENGQADWIGYSVPSDRLAEIAQKYPKQIVLSQLTANWYLPMNTRLAPFDRP